MRPASLTRGSVVALCLGIFSVVPAMSESRPPVQVQKLTASTIPFTFGASVAVHRKYIAVGAPSGFTAGAVYVFKKVRGMWQEIDILLPSDPPAPDGSEPDDFGGSVAINGKLLVVGAPNNDDFVGSAYVFELQGGEWRETAKLVPPDGSGVARFGYDVAFDGTTIVVGAPGGDVDPEGRAYVFTRDGSRGAGWSVAAMLTPDGGDSGTGAYLGFGRSVSVGGKFVAVGAPGHDIDDDHSDVGATFVFRAAGGDWSQEAMVIAADAVRWWYLGEDVALRKKTLVVGSRGDFDERGAAYVFTRGGGRRAGRAGWTQAAVLMADDADPGQWTGAQALAYDKKNLVLGAPFDDDAGGHSGSAYWFSGKKGNWTQRDKVVGSDIDADDQFGSALALQGKTLVVGARGQRDQEGAAYVYTLR